MARFDTTGIAPIIKQMEALKLTESDVADDMLMAAAGTVADAWREVAQQLNLKDDGDMIQSIGFPHKPKTVDAVRMIDIYPQGVDRRGIRNAEKAFILNYGTSHTRRYRYKRKHKKYPGPGIPALGWVDKADDLAAEPVQDIMETVFDNYLRKKGLID